MVRTLQETLFLITIETIMNKLILVLSFIAMIGTLSCATSAHRSNVLMIANGRDTLCRIEDRVCENYSIVRIPGFFKGYASILKDTVNAHNRYDFKNAYQHYIPDTSVIKHVEQLLSNKEVSEFTSHENGKFKELYWEFYRQYSGYISKKHDTIIVVNLLDFGNGKEAKKFFKKEWKYRNYGIIIPCTDCKYPTIKYLEVNLQTSSINTLYSKGLSGR
jgi:hypothetical protein